MNNMDITLSPQEVQKRLDQYSTISVTGNKVIIEYHYNTRATTINIKEQNKKKRNYTDEHRRKLSERMKGNTFAKLKGKHKS